MTNTVSKTVSDETLNCIITIESAGKLDARPLDRNGKPMSTALGLGQFLNKTWDGVVKSHRPDLLEGRTVDEVRALRKDGHLSIELLARFTEDNQRIVGMNCTGGDLYLAHFLGVGDAKDLFRADPDTPVSKLVSPDVIKANPNILTGKNAGQVRAWAAKKMAAAGGHGWVAKYYKPAAPKLQPQPEPETETAEDIPDPQDAPAGPSPTAVVPVDAPPEVQEKQIQQNAERDAEPRTSWLKRKWKGVTGTIGSFFGIGGAAMFDWRIVAVLAGVLFIFAVAIILFMGPGDVRAWVRKQVA